MVSFEARLRGYDVQTLPNLKGSMLEKLSYKTNLAWIDPITNTHPEYIFDEKANTPRRFLAFLEKIIESGRRYTLEFSYRNDTRVGHILSIGRLDDGKLRLYDPQTGDIHIEGDLLSYFNHIKFTSSTYGVKYATPPKLLRVDNQWFNLDVVNHILTERR